jgi:hypothetical protein
MKQITACAWKNRRMADEQDEVWRPLGVDTDEQIAEYDALHEGVPAWMHSSFWAWIQSAITAYIRYGSGNGKAAMLDTDLTEAMCQVLRIPLPNLRSAYVDPAIGRKNLSSAITTLQKHASPLQIADYLLAHTRGKPNSLSELLSLSKSAYEVGVRSSRPGLVRRVPLGVQVSADSVMMRAGRAGTRLAKAWELLYGLQANASEAYRLAILAVEDAAIPVVSPTNPRATLGTVLKQMEDQGGWRLPMDREHKDACSSEVLIGMMRLLWHGQHDRHGGQPSAPGNVSIEEAQVGVSLAVVLVQWFSAALVRNTAAPANP